MENKRLKDYGLGTDKKKEVLNIQNFQNNFLKTERLFRDVKNIKKIFAIWKYKLLWISLIFFGGIGPGYAMDATLQWSANTEPDIAGYKIYYKTGYTGPVYDGIGATEGDSPVIVTVQELYDADQPEYTIHGLEDSEVYYFVLTAFDVDDFESAYSNEVCFNSPDCYIEAGQDGYDSDDDDIASEGGGGGGGCFIATAAYGSLMERHVKILREFRDRFLLTNCVGKTLVNLYYKYSPPLADFIAEHDNLRAMVRVSLLPFVGFSRVALRFGILAAMLLALMLVSSLVGIVILKKKNMP
jgi:hypothetical protein